jgi:hypothetical protein
MVMGSIDDADAAILAHVGRYRLTVPRALAKTGLLETFDEDLAAEKLQKLVKRGLLNQGMLCPTTSNTDTYFYLSPRAALDLGHDVAWAQPLKSDARVECYARLMFCCCGNVFRQPLTKKEFVETFPGLWIPGRPIQYYLEPPGEHAARLAFFKVDKLGAGRWDRIIDFCTRFVRKRTNGSRNTPQHRASIAAYDNLITRKQFQITILTALPEKKLAIEIELERRNIADLYVPPIVVHVVDGLFDLLCPAKEID